MLNGPQHARNSTAKCCAICGGKFGLIRHYSWRAAFCSKNCLARFRARRERDRRWLWWPQVASIAARSPRRMGPRPVSIGT